MNIRIACTTLKKRPAVMVPFAIFALMEIYLLYNMFIPSKMPGYGAVVFVYLPERAPLITMAIVSVLVFPLTFGITPSIAEGKTFRDSVLTALHNYLNMICAALMGTFSLATAAFFLLRIFGKSLVMNIFDITPSYVIFYSFIGFLLILVSVFLIYIPPGVIRSGSIRGFFHSFTFAAENYAKSFLALIIPLTMILVSFFLLVIIPFMIPLDIAWIRLFTVLFSVFSTVPLTLLGLIPSFEYMKG